MLPCMNTFSDSSHLLIIVSFIYHFLGFVTFLKTLLVFLLYRWWPNLNLCTSIWKPEQTKYKKTLLFCYAFSGTCEDLYLCLSWLSWENPCVVANVILILMSSTFVRICYVKNYPMSVVVESHYIQLSSTEIISCLLLRTSDSYREYLNSFSYCNDNLRLASTNLSHQV